MLCEDGLIENHYYDYGYLLTADYSAAGALRKVRRISYTCSMGTTYIILLYIYLLLKFRSDKSRTGDYFLRLDQSPWHVHRPLSSKSLLRSAPDRLDGAIGRRSLHIIIMTSTK